MRCRSCGDTTHPGYMVWRGSGSGPNLFHGSLVPCPECCGTAIVNACEGQPFESGGSRSYRAYYLDTRGMIVLAEVIDAPCDDVATDTALEHLVETRPSLGVSSLEVWEGRRCVGAQPRPAASSPGQPIRSSQGFADRLW